MTIGDQTKMIISKAKRKRKGKETQQVVYKTIVGKHKGKPLYASQTRHEAI